MVREIASVLRSTFVRAHFVLEDMGALSMTIVNARKINPRSACRNSRQAVSAALYTYRINEASNICKPISDLDSRSINAYLKRKPGIYAECKFQALTAIVKWFWDPICPCIV